MTIAWAYEFESALSLPELEAALNEGPSSWTSRESEWYGDYLISRPAAGIRVRIHDRSQPFFGSLEREAGPRYKCRVDLHEGGREARTALEETLQKIIGALQPGDLREIDGYD